MKKYYILLVAMVLTTCAYSQFWDSSIYVKGTIITYNDTIKCYLELQDGYSGQINYKVNQDDKKKLKIYSSSIKKIITTTSHFERVNYDGSKSELMKLLHSGEISLYKHTYSVSNAPINNNGMLISTGSREKEKLYLVKKNLTIKVQKRKTQVVLKELMSDYDKIQSDIEEFNHRDIMFEYNLKQLLSKYNRWFKYEKSNK